MPSFKMWLTWFKLRPNCLLTRYPVLLISKAEGLQVFGDPFFWFKLWLQAHGYEVERLSLRATQSAMGQALLREAKAHGAKFHLIHGFSEPPVDRQFFECTRDQEAPFFCTVTQVKPNQSRFSLFCPWRWREQLVAFREQILNLAIFLAENDLKCSH